MKKFTEVKELVASLEADADKFYNKGNRLNMPVNKNGCILQLNSAVTFEKKQPYSF